MIHIKGLHKSFAAKAGSAAVLRDVSLSVKRGEIYGVIGRSGAGKSTLVRCINLLERPNEGSVTVDGHEITALSGAALREQRRKIGMIFQHFNLLSSRTVYDNVALPLELAGMKRDQIDREILPLLDLVGLSAKRNAYPAQLSGGQKQRVAIARALASKPAVLLCDEATSALDPETTQSILALLKDINEKLALTIVLITHEMPVVKAICHRVAVLDQGKVVEEGTVFDIFTQPRADVTRSLVHDLVHRDLPPWLVDKMAAYQSGPSNRVLRITFSGPSANSPIISELAQRFGLYLNILQANVDYIRNLPFGIIVVEAIGPREDVDAAIDYIHAHDLKAEVLGHVAGAAQSAA